MRKNGPETFAAFYPDQLPKQRHRDDTDPVVQALLRLSEAGIKHDSKLQTLLFTYLLGESSEEALAELGFSESLINLDDKLFVLTLALRCLIGVKAKIGTGGKVGPACRVYLVLDEVENLLALPEDMAWAFTHWLEHLTHEVGDGLTFWLHIKTAGPTTMKDLQKRLGHRQLQEWVTDLVT